MEKIRSSSVEKETKDARKHSLIGPNTNLPLRIRKSKITLGVCAMKKKVESKPMKQILSRLRCPQIEIVSMWQYLNIHWSSWPVVDALICFYSDGFPYLMAWKYVKKYKPYLINDLQKQQLLWDRTVIYDILNKIKVPVAKHYFVFRDYDHLKNIEQKCFGRMLEPEQDLQLHRLASECKTSNTYTDTNQTMRLERNMSGHPSQSIDLRIEHAEEKKQSSLEKKDNHEDKVSRGTKKRETSKHIEQANVPTLLRQYYQDKATDRPNYQIDQAQEDFITLKYGQSVIKLKKPFVQKPFDSENHQICVYYPSEMGGGRKKLFRKKKNTSSEYQPEQNSVRRDGNYIYEQYLPTNAFDIKVYTIGPYYMYAEARKSPTLDGVVQRNIEGKQMRYPVILTPDQKYICNRIVEEFGQDICGFDLLRANGKSYVCDVNGWSFVKGNPKYWEDCAKILKKKIIGHFFPEKLLDKKQKDKLTPYLRAQYRPPLNYINPKVEELRSIVSIFRHADRSPKMKLKIKTKDKRFVSFFDGVKKEELKFKDAKNLTKFLNITNEIIAEMDHNDPIIKQFMQLKLVLEKGGHFQGLTRKMQLKVLERQTIQGEGKGIVTKVMLILKWGGDLTFVGYQDAIQLGQKMRMERYGDNDCLSLYSSYRHDLKTYASDEGRCIKTAAAFLKGFLSIEGQLAPIIVSMIQADAKAQRLLDCTHQQNHSAYGDKVCERLYDMMNRDEDLMTSYTKYCKKQDLCQSMLNALKTIGEPRKQMDTLNRMIKDLVNEIQRIYLQSQVEEEGDSERRSSSMPMEDNENIMLVYSRWSKLKKDFYIKETDKFNISKIPEIYDTIRHDYVKNSHIFSKIDHKKLESLYNLAKTLAHFVVINEQGINDEQRIKVGTDICLPLLEKILVDLMFWKERSEDQGYWKYKNPLEGDNWRHIRTRLYFTSASHMYSLLNILSLGNNRQLLRKSPEEDAKKVFNIIYMSYLSHIEFRLYQNLTVESENPNRFRLEITFSPKFHKDTEMKQYSLGGSGFTINEIQEFIESFLNQKNTEEGAAKQ